MPTNRRPTASSLRTGRITPAAIKAYRRLRSWDGKCTCPATAPYPGQVFVSSDPACQERERRYQAELVVYEAARARCVACPAVALEHARLLEELRRVLKPWQSGLSDFLELEAALEAAAESKRSKSKRRRVEGGSS
jgi:hypothetical protein